MSISFPMKVFREYEGGPLELHIARFTWQTRRYRRRVGPVPIGVAVSRKLSFKIQLVPQDLWVGLFWKKDGHQSWTWYLCLLPCLPIRLKLKSSCSGLFP